MGRVIYSYMTTHTLLPNILTVHKWVEIEMADRLTRVNLHIRSLIYAVNSCG